MRFFYFLVILSSLSMTMSGNTFRYSEEISPKEKVCKKSPNNYKSKTKYTSLSSYVSTLGEPNKKNKNSFENSSLRLLYPN